MTYKSQFIEQFQIAAAPIPSPGERGDHEVVGEEWRALKVSKKPDKMR